MIIIYKDHLELERKIDRAIIAINQEALKNDLLPQNSWGRAPSYYERGLIRELNEIKERLKDQRIMVGLQDWEEKWINRWADKYEYTSTSKTES